MALREIGQERREVVLVLACSARGSLIAAERVAAGAVDRAPLPVREILECALRHDARAFAVAHNHPSGEPAPSLDDIAATDLVAAGARATGLRFLGHVVVAAGGWAEVRR